MTDYQNDAYWMAKALRLAEKGLNTTSPNPRVGCVIVRDGRLVGEGYHERAGTPHAEVHALAKAGDAARGATAYVTLEPCSHHGRTPPCAEALIEAGVGRVVAAIEDPNPQVGGRGLALLEEAGIATRAGVLAEDAETLNRGFLKRMRTGHPWLTLKMASSLDGATALASGESQWITGPEARQDVQLGRARSCAILTGVGTVLTDDPSLNVRLPDVTRQPDRIVLDTRLRTSAEARLFKSNGRVRILHGPQADADSAARLGQVGADLTQLPLESTTGQLDLRALMDWLGEQGYNEIWVEAGAILAGSLLKTGLIDELLLYQAPKLLGANVRPLLDWSIPSLAQAVQLVPVDTRQIGADLRWRLRPVTVSDTA
ncbi:bifunctional diaminohydroxyphosphoribosylaminopyrimidine deaminase/5-amino-6-(5-phosphoribosylamino)uracil reductase RibD [Saccharospirillum salsuginis]|uniref:Riboflavin biosynthesis protein RibD n=1 Tax=Saccharospirillum salsuginis TaxID=418750 RepID=A0A918K9X5_9GAMM|nr:bifunctional diaminohydroxyphosphoribosylaminopyrimidine deaminase/5-amino-6-(5-phosphoribosylamino)uracil reductase RibD [Saccharospirillum salsuginis]GGX56144.1 riboflavin biosynthesis protein RibD [Saccharospirillum salsuginis]